MIVYPSLSIYNEMLPLSKLRELAAAGATDYLNAQPYAHSVFDDVFDERVLDLILEEFEESDRRWKEFDTKYEKKFQSNNDADMGPATRAFIHNLNSQPFLEFLETLTGIKGLIPDPYLVGAGLHKIPRGGRLGVHIDFNRHEEMRVFRRLNVLVYLNKNWKEEYGGHFELWDENKRGCQKKLLPIFNRMAIFTTTDTSFHGHPEPLNCPEGRFRRSLALYFYTAEESGAQGRQVHSTVFLDKDNKREELSFEPEPVFKRVARKIYRKLKSTK